MFTRSMAFQLPILTSSSCDAILFRKVDIRPIARA